MGLAVFSFSTPWIPLRLLLFRLRSLSLTHSLCTGLPSDFARLHLAHNPKSQVSECNWRRRSKSGDPSSRYFASPPRKTSAKKDPVYLLMKSHRVWDAEEQSGFFAENKSPKKVQATHHSSGQEEWRTSVFPFSPAFAACAGLVENGHSDHFDLWTYPLVDTHMPTGFCKWARTFLLTPFFSHSSFSPHSLKHVSFTRRTDL